MKEVYEFLKQAGVFFLATEEQGQPRVRPFGALAIIENRLYIQMGKVKKVYRQLKANNRLEICAMKGSGEWIRLTACAVEDDRLSARQEFLAQNESLRSLYAADDGNCVVFYLTDATAVISSFTAPPKTITF